MVVRLNKKKKQTNKCEKIIKLELQFYLTNLFVNVNRRMSSFPFYVSVVIISKNNNNINITKKLTDV